MSSVVAMELFSGCVTKHQQDDLANFLKPFEKAARLIVPDHVCFREAGRVMAKLGSEGMSVVQRQQMQNDVLIAVSAARAGTVVVTGNVRDFVRIEKHVAVRWMVPS